MVGVHEFHPVEEGGRLALAAGLHSAQSVGLSFFGGERSRCGCGGLVRLDRWFGTFTRLHAWRSRLLSLVATTESIVLKRKAFIILVHHLEGSGRVLFGAGKRGEADAFLLRPIGASA